MDIDGTLWDYEGNIPDSAKLAVDRLKKAGHIPIICTGRARGHVRNKTLLDMGFSGIIAACGAHVEYDGKIIYESFMNDEEIRRAAELSVKYGLPIVFEGKRKHWISAEGFEHDDFVDRMIEIMGEDAVIFSEYTPDIKANKYSGDILLSSDYVSFKKELSPDICFIDHELDVAPGIKQAEFGEDPKRIVGVFEAITPGTSKAKGMQILCDFLGMDMKDSFAIGDSNNDIEMVDAAGVGIAMGNSSERLKKIANYVTTGIHEDGVYNALEYFGLLG